MRRRIVTPKHWHYKKRLALVKYLQFLRGRITEYMIRVYDDCLHRAILSTDDEEDTTENP